ncbi:MAG TPA: hypothetical protein ENK52_05635 [Saprospiraceae bacterium]|nr:hypothetical protein [Saprospiraceae bacterium]
MRKFSLLLNLWLLLAVIIFMPSCTDDIIIDPTVIAPSVSLVQEDPYLYSDATLAAGEWFEIKVSVSKNDNFLRTISVLEDGVKISDYTARLTYNGDAFEANPKLLTDLEKEGFEWVIGIKAHEESDVTKKYEIEISDDAQEVSSTSINITTETVPPSFSFLEEAPYWWENVSIEAGTSFEVKLVAQAGSSPLASVAVYEDEVLISDLTRLKIDAVEFTANPQAVTAEAQTDTSWVIRIKSHDGFGKKTYKVVVMDEAGNSDFREIDVSVGTAVTSLEGKLLFNSGGDRGTGGLNLLTGVGTGSSDASAHIKDMGIDLSKPLAENWLKKIKGINGSILRKPGANLLEGFSFQNIQYSEEIVGIFEGSTEIIESAPIILGDIFTVKNGDNYFLLEVTAVNSTVDNNEDSIEFSIKY